MSTKPHATITHQACEMLYCMPGRPMTRYWSRWTDGSVTHNDSVSATYETADGWTMHGSMGVNIGMDRDLMPPAHLQWIDTVAVRAELVAAGKLPA